MQTSSASRRAGEARFGITKKDVPRLASRRMFRMACLFFILYAAGAGIEAQTQPAPNLMPLPAGFQLGTESLPVDGTFSLALVGHSEPRLERAAQRFLRHLSRQTGIPMNTKPGDAAKATLIIRTEHASKEIQEPGEDESYDLEVHASGAKLTAATPLGALNGLQTFLQLVAATPKGFAAPGITIRDKPRFVWRGLMIDSSRHFMHVDVLKRNLDGMSAVKLNVLHWHLSDNQGFRVESKRFPKLQELGSDGLYYTQEEIRDVIAFGRDRGIRVMPEFDMPGHTTAMFVGYPELASAPGPYTIEREWGVFDPAIDPTQESTYKFLSEFIAEMARLFPDPYFHIGGDEVNGKQWNANPRIQEFMRAHGLKNNADLQAYFNKRLQEIVARNRKIMVGWDEVLHPDLPKSIVVQSWRGQQSLADAASQGYRGLLSHGYYLDLIWAAAQHYAADPLAGAAANLTPEQQKLILGGEACMWAEYVSADTVDSRIWPRVAAVAERLWSPQSAQDVNAMYARLEEVSRRLDWLGLAHNSSYEPMLRRIAGRKDVAALRVLADVVEPVKGYARGELAAARPTSADPLIRLVDAARPESDTARRFAGLVDAYLADASRSSKTSVQICKLLTAWRDQHADLQPLFDNSFLLKEAQPLSEDLSALADAGLDALAALDRGERLPDAWKTAQLATVERAKKPKAQLLLMVAASVQKLIEASSRGAAATAH